MTGQLQTVADSYPRCMDNVRWESRRSRSTVPETETSMDRTGREEAGEMLDGAGRRCAVCREEASGMYFGALVCLPCKSFFIRSTKEGLPRFTCLVNGSCDVTHGNRLRCQYCRFQTCLSVGMCRKEKPEIVQPAEGQVLCRVCHDIANGVHFGVPTCEGCKKFFRRALKESNSYFCKFEKTCAMNPRNRNSCRYCRYNMCINVGMSRTAIRMGRPKKMGMKDLRYARENSNPYNVPGHADDRPASTSPISPHSHSGFTFPSCASVIKVHGYPSAKSSDRLAAKSVTNQGSFPGLSEAELGTRGGDDLMSIMPERSVIRSCGKPSARAAPGGVDRRGADFRQTVLTHGNIAAVSAAQGNIMQQQQHHMYSDHSNSCHSPSHSSLSASPNSDMSSNFSESGTGKDSLMDIEDDLTDILSSLSQYTPHQQATTNQNIESVQYSDLRVASSPHTGNHLTPSPLAGTATQTHDVTVKSETSDFRLSCQYEANATSGLHSPCFTPLDNAENVIKQEVECPSPTTPDMPGQRTYNASWTAQQIGERDWTSPPSNLFSQMYNSLMLTYNLGALTETQPEDGRYTHEQNHLQNQGVLGGHSGQYTANTVTPLFI